MKRIIDRYFCYIVFALALLFSAYILFAADSKRLLPMPVKGMDQYTILMAAKELYSGNLPDKPYFFSPSYTLFITFLITVTRGSLFYMRLLQAVFFAFTPVFVYKLSRLLRVHREASQVGALLFCFYGPGILLSLGFLRAGMLGLAFLLYVYVLVKAFIRRSTLLYALCGFLAVVCLFGRPNFIPIIFIPLLALLFSSLRRHIRPRFVVAYFMVLAFLVLPFMLYNKIRFDAFSISPGHTKNIIYESGYFSGRKGDALSDIAIHTIGKIPHNLYQFASSYEQPNSFSFYAHRDVIDFMWILLVPFNLIFLMAIIGGLSSYRNFGSLTVSAYSGAYIVTMISFAIFYRFRYPVVPLLCVLAGIGIYKVLTIDKPVARIAVLLGVVCLLFLTHQNPDKKRSAGELLATADMIIQSKAYPKAISYLEHLDKLGVETTSHWQTLYMILVQEGDVDGARSIEHKLKK